MKQVIITGATDLADETYVQFSKTIPMSSSLKKRAIH
jgi:hypothetical protein